MKARLLAVILGLAIALLQAGAWAATSASDIKIYYINGILNTQTEAANSTLALIDAMSPLRATYIYNPEGIYACVDSAGNLCFSNGADFGELNASKVNEENYAADYAEFVVGNSNLSLRNKYSSTWVQHANAFLNKYLAHEMVSVISVMNTVVKQTLNSVRSNKKVLLVAHSQGNLIVNLAWVKLVTLLTAEELQQVRILNVANTSRFSPHGHNLTHGYDFEIYTSLPELGVLNARVSATAECAIGGHCPFMVAEPTLVSATLDSRGSWDSHNFVKTYLSLNPVTEPGGNTTTFRGAFTTSAGQLLRAMGYQNNPPAASFSMTPATAQARQALTFDASSSTDDGTDGGVGIVNYAWDFGDGQTSTTNSNSGTNHAFAAPGTYQVKLTVTDDAGAQSSMTQPITVAQASTQTASFFEDFLGTTLSPTIWGQEGINPATVASGLATTVCSSQISTKDKVTFSGSKIIVEGRFGGLVTFFRSTSLVLLDTVTGDAIQIGDTDYGNTPGYIHRAGLFGFFTAGSGMFNLAQQGNENSVSVMKEYRMTLSGTSLKAERGDTLSAITETITRTLPTSISGRTFYLVIGQNYQFCPGTVDWVRVTVQ